MIIVDYSGIAIAAIFSQDRPDEVEESLIRHMILNSLRRYNVKFRNEYGQMIIACDSTSWRKEKFANYKAKRKTSRDESPLDPAFYKFEHICKGDTSDGVPNMLSADDTFVIEGGRQTPMRTKKIKEWYDACKGDASNIHLLRSVMTEEQYRNFCRNKLMIDLDCIPTDIADNITNKYNIY